MRRRILVAILTITAAAVLMFGIPLAIIVARFADNDATLRVERQAVLASRTVPTDFATSGDPVELPVAHDGVDVGLYNIAGTLVAGHGPVTADAPTLSAIRNRVVEHESSSERIVAVPVTRGEAIVGVIRAAQPTRNSDARSLRITALIAALGVAVLAVGAGVGVVVSGRLARPVRRLAEAAIQLGHGDFTITVAHSRVPELEHAGLAMTATARRLDDLVNRARQFSADASHQLRTPLAGLKATIETELAFPRPERTDVLRDALDDIERLERTIGELLAIARTSSVRSSTTSIAEVLVELRTAWHGPLARQGRPLRIADATNCPAVIGNAVMLRHALDVLLDNAITHGAGEVAIQVHVATDIVTISVSDDGPGFPEQPPTTPVQAPRGRALGDEQHGMGLPLARRLVDAMPGRLNVSHAGRHPRIDVVLTTATPPLNTDLTSGG